MKSKLYCSAGGLAFILAVHAPVASAQTAARTAGTLDEVVVTAQKRTQNVQDVPISVQVMSGATITNSGFRNIQDLAQSTPTLRAQKGPSGDSVGIRGVQAATGPSFEQAVGVFIDGVYYGRSRGTRAGFLDLDRAEVLKGPQSIYFGNNAIAGAYNIVTANPGKTLNGYVTANYEPVARERDLEGAVGGPISATMGLRLAASLSQVDGWVKYPFGGGRGPSTKDATGRLTYIWNPTESFDVAVKAGAYNIRGNNAQGFELYNCPVKAPFVVNGSTCTRSLAVPGANLALDWVSVTNPTFNRQRGQNASVTANYRFGDGYTLTAVTGWWHLNYAELFDQDYSPLQVASNVNFEETTQTSQEIRLTSPADRRFSYIAGAYYHRQDRQNSANGGTFAPSAAAAALIPAGTFPYQTIFSDYRETSMSAFVAGTYNVTDSLRATVGVRRIQVRKSDLRDDSIGYTTDFTVRSLTPLPAATQLALGRAQGLGVFRLPFALRQSDTLPSLNVEWKFAPDKMLYYTASKGFQAGGFDENSRTLSTNMVFAPETVVAQEVGLKAEWYDRRLTTNIDYFYATYHDLQRSVAQVINDVGFLFVSAVGTQVSQGLEAQIRWKATDRLELTLNATRLSSKYGSDVVGSCSTTQTFLTPAGKVCVQNLAGKSPQGVAPYSGEFRARYVQPVLNGLNLTAQGAVVFNGAYETDGSYESAGHQDAYQRYDFRLGLSPVQGPWEVALIGRNVTNEKIKLTCGPPTGATGSYGCVLDRKNSFMLQANYRF